jgi:hypothetical protein
MAQTQRHAHVTPLPLSRNLVNRVRITSGKAAVARSRYWEAFRFFFASRGVGGTRDPGLLLLSCLLSACCGVDRYRGADELLKGSFVDHLPFAEVDRTPQSSRLSEELLRVLEGGSAEEGELHHLLVRFPRADAAVMGPDVGSRRTFFNPFPRLLDVGVGIVDELTDMNEGLSSPIPQLNPTPGRRDS